MNRSRLSLILHALALVCFVVVCISLAGDDVAVLESLWLAAGFALTSAAFVVDRLG